MFQHLEELVSERSWEILQVIPGYGLNVVWQKKSESVREFLKVFCWNVFFLNVKCCLISKHIYIYKYDYLFLLVLPNNLSLISSLFGKFSTIPANHGPIFLTLLSSISEVISDLYPIIGSASQEELLTENEKLKETLGFLERVRFFFSNKCDVLSFGRGCYVVFHIPSS